MGRFVDIDQVVLPIDLWAAAARGEDDAQATVREIIDGLSIYRHALPVADGEMVVSLREIVDVMPCYISVKISTWSADDA